MTFFPWTQFCSQIDFVMVVEQGVYNNNLCYITNSKILMKKLKLILEIKESSLNIK